MHALVNAFMRCLSFLLPPSWLCVSVCLWAGNVSEEPNPRARFKGSKPLTYEEVAPLAAVEAQGGSSSVSPAGCVSLASASSPSVPQAWIGGLWQAVERVFGAPWVLLRHHWCQKKRRAALRAPYPVCAFEPSESRGFQGGISASAASGGTLPCSGNMSRSTESPILNQCVLDASAEHGFDEVITVDQHSQEMGTVTITVAIQAAEEDEEPVEVSPSIIDFLGGSCSEDEYGRHDKSRFESLL
ncbi:hypothetical protein KUCAC02_002077 [Chaenocephalus aceratus]|uniref:Uncharacterized protein n=1 Tax=Chaenocephalus aceratus TaxID=36190 RepID=A0ACB9XTP9_CHAAC|nr:hypothetical protein KUCAC02_002077 [Chaenocephalus aceratus]